MSHSAYQTMQKNAAAPRDAEYLVFTKATRGLIDAAKAGHEDLKALIEAIDFNRQLWNALASDCASAANQLPEQTRAQIISLSRWVSSHSSAVMRKTEDVAPLIDINRMMMDGLSGKTANQTAEAQQP